MFNKGSYRDNEVTKKINHFFLIGKNSRYSIGTMFNKGSYRDNRILKNHKNNLVIIGTMF